MIAPRGLLGSCAAVWGIALGFPIVGVVLGIFLEGFRFMRVRAPLSERTVASVLRATFLLAIVAFVILIATQRAPLSLYLWLRALPILLLPLPILQMLCGGALGYAALRHSMRFSGTPVPDERRWDATHGYALGCLLAAGTSSTAGDWYFEATFALIAWGIVANAPGRRIKGLALVLCAGTLGFGVATGLYKLQAQLEEWGEEFFEDMFTPDTDPFRERTRIGDMGRIKLNDRIVMRAVPEGPRPMQILLRESSFDVYRNGAWEVSNRTVSAVPREGEAWRLRAGEGGAHVILRRSFPRGEGLLPLPLGSSSIRDLDAATVEATETRAVRVKGVTGPVAMRVAYDEDQEGVPSSIGTDLEVPEGLRPALEQIVVSEGLRAATAQDSIEAVNRYFGTGFAYSLQLTQREARRGRSISDFLLRDRKGHCEYFATATVLLLRQAGIPARYAVGYSAQEFSPLERAFVVRHRHAHAWVLARVDGRWTTVDTTPANWADQEAEAARSPLGIVLDLFSWIWDLFQRAWAASDASQLVAGAVVIVLLIASPWIARRLPRFRRTAPRAAPPDRIATTWREIEARIGALGFARDPRETVRAWTRRLSTEPAAREWHARLAELAALYYRARYDPAAPPDTVDRLAALATGLTIER